MSKFRQFGIYCCKCGKEIGKIISPNYFVDTKDEPCIKGIENRDKIFRFYCLDCKEYE